MHCFCLAWCMPNLCCMCIIKFSHAELTSPTPEARLPFTHQTPRHLPSTERSENIIHLRRSKSENVLSLQTLTSLVTPPRSSSSVTPLQVTSLPWEQSTIQPNGFPSVTTDLANAGKLNLRNNLLIAATSMDNLPAGELQKYKINGDVSTPPLSFVNIKNDEVVRLSSPSRQKNISSDCVQSPVRSTILHTSLQVNDFASEKFENSESQISFGDDRKSCLFGRCEEDLSQNIGRIDLNLFVPLPKERKSTTQQMKEESGMLKNACCMLSSFVCFYLHGISSNECYNALTVFVIWFELSML